ncbi:MAG: hypothetical protein AAF585_05430 [Verrucomicrobiota bacterium]
MARRSNPRKRASVYAHEPSRRKTSQNRRKASPKQRARKAKVLSAFADGIVQDSGPVGIPLTWKTSAIGVVLIPLVLITWQTFLSSVKQATLNDEFWREPQFWFFHMGIVMWIVVLAGLRGKAMIWMYVLGHEYTHAIAALCCGGKLFGWPVVTSSGGQVLTNKNNVFISLAPYMVPIYSVVATLIYALLHLFLEIGPIYERAFFGVIGFTWAFHLTFTFLMVTRSQPDLQNYGVFFSLVFIVLVNLLIVSALFVTASPTMEWAEFGAQWWGNVKAAAANIWNGVGWFFGEIGRAVNSTR